ncbi:MAG: hypothetical protein KatS3mg111_1227 [Pirellulaceae bacterium]|nr:MAG: hypothetical protein KatS3mg111_1227 [Pirellulaceae bacterium]
MWADGQEVLRIVNADAEGPSTARLMNRYLWGAAVDQLLADEQYMSWWSPDAFHGSSTCRPFGTPGILRHELRAPARS